MRKNKDAIGIYPRGNVFWLTTQTRGKRTRVSLETDDFAQAIVRAREFRTRPGRIGCSFMDAIERFLAWKRNQGKFTTASANARFYILRHFANWVDVPPDSVTEKHVRDFYERKVSEHGPVTANGYAMILRSFFSWAGNKGLVTDHNPLENLELVKEPHSGRRLKDFCSEEQRDALIAACPREDLAFVLYAGFHAGLRKNEIIEARPWWFDLRNGLLHLRATATMKFKDREERTIPLTKGFAEFLKSYRLREPYMLRPDVKHGRNRYRYDFSRPFFDHVKTQGLERIGQTRLTPHLMRHTFASLLVSNGVSLYKVAVWLGDDPRVVESHYARLRPRDPDIERSFHKAPVVGRRKSALKFAR